MKTIARDTLEAMTEQHPIEAAVWRLLISDGEAQIVENGLRNEESKCKALV